MPTALTIDDFKPFSITCEVRYRNAPLIFDRTGQVIEEMREFVTDLSITGGTPQQTGFTAEEGIFQLEIGACRVTGGRPGSHTEAYAKLCKRFFGTVADRFEIGVFTRIGLRYILRREFKSEDESKAALASMMLANLMPAKRFNSSDSPTEVLFRWEDAQVGAFFRLKSEKIEIKLTVPHEFRDTIPKFDKSAAVLTLDTDYYTVAPVQREQWNCEDWLPEKLRIVRKEIDGILQGGEK